MGKILKRNAAVFTMVVSSLSITLSGCGANLKSSSTSDNTSTSTGSNEPPVPPPPTGSYAVYPSCASPASTYQRTLYVDAALGSDLGDGSQAKPYATLTFLFANKLVQPGDHLVVAKGSYAALALSKYNYPALVASPSWVWFDFQPGADISGIAISDISKILVTGATIHKTSGDIVTVNSALDIVIANNAIYSSSASPDSLTAAQWMGLANAAFVRDGSCTSLYKNVIRNVRFGISFYTTITTYPNNSLKGLADGNDLRGFSGDASRGIASDLIFRNNSFVDGYVSDADGDGNHDDMFQGFALGGCVFENLLIEDNFMLDRSSASRTLVSEYQGISIFDGLYKNVVVRRNIVLSGAYHGISMYGTDGLLVENNTVLNTGNKTLWIGAFISKGGVAPINNVIRNNLADKFSNVNLSSSTNNFVIAAPVSSFVLFDLASGTFDLHLKPTDPAYGKAAGAL